MHRHLTALHAPQQGFGVELPRLGCRVHRLPVRSCRDGCWHMLSATRSRPPTGVAICSRSVGNRPKPGRRIVNALRDGGAFRSHPTDPPHERGRRLTATFHQEKTPAGAAAKSRWDSVMHYSRGGFITQARTGKAAPRRPPADNPPGGIYPCKPGGPNDYVYLLTSRANPEHWPRLLKLIGREDLIGNPRYDTPDARIKCEAEVDEIVTSWTRQRTKHEAMAQLSAVGVPAGAVLDTQELVDEPSFYERGILQQMTH